MEGNKIKASDYPLSASVRAAVEATSGLPPPERDVAIGLAFASAAGLPRSALGPPGSTLSSDRATKAGRSAADLLEEQGVGRNDDALEARLGSCAEGLRLIASGDVQVPRVRFGGTGRQVSIVTCGGMRLQQTWAQDKNSMDLINADCQSNLVEIIRHALSLGINHFETARGYGCSETQYGAAFREIFASGEIRREDILIQTKLNPTPTAAEFRRNMEDCFERLGLQYIDFFSMHGLNLDYQYDLCFNNGDDENLIDVVREYIAAGKIRHLGFSTHGQPDLIRRFIESGAFEYANIHYHYFGSYTASGGGPTGSNLSNIRLCKERDMGVFIISPYDKGGRLYAPSRRLRDLTTAKGGMEPMAFGSQWLWHHADFYPDAAVHTIVCGAARASDLDEPCAAAHGAFEVGALAEVRAVAERMDVALANVGGAEWAEKWHVGLPSWFESKTGSFYTQTVWLYNVIKAYGMLDFAKERYSVLESNVAKLDPNLTLEENMKKWGLVGYGYMPGLAYIPGRNDSFEEDLSALPVEQKEKIRAACDFVRLVCGKDGQAKSDAGCEMAYDMRPWTAFPER